MTSPHIATEPITAGYQPCQDEPEAFKKFLEKEMDERQQD
jgi:hypothetical protein